MIYNPKALKHNDPFPKPLMYLSGGFSVPVDKEKGWLKKTQTTHKCFSYAYVRPDHGFYYDKRVHGTMDVDIKKGVGIMMDSSAFSFHQLAKTLFNKGMTEKDVSKARDGVIKDYVHFINEYQGKFDFYVNFDYVKHAPTVYKMQSYLEKLGIRPIPVYHGDAGNDWLRRYIDDGHDYICIGSDKKRRQWNIRKIYLDDIFNMCAKYGKNVRLHGLAVTSYDYMFRWPWYSVDSSTWAKLTGYGQIMIINPAGAMQYVHVSDKVSKNNKNSFLRMERSVQKSIVNFVESKGFNFDKVRTTSYERGEFNAWMFAHVHSLVTKPTETVKWRSLL